MKRQNHKHLQFQTQKDNIVINIEARQVIKFFRWVFGWKKRKKQLSINEMIESRRVKHIQSNHRANHDKAWR